MSNPVVVLDVNGVLLHREFNTRPTMPCTSLGHVAVDTFVHKFSIFLRPNAREFVRWLSERSDVVVWSTMTTPMLDALVKVIFVDCKAPLLILDQRHCTDTGISIPGKPKKMLIKEVGGIAELRDRRVLVIDDAPYKVKSNGCDVLCPVTWHPLTLRSEINNALAVDGEIRKAVEAIVSGTQPVLMEDLWETSDDLLVALRQGSK
jgi:hypothetical protein